jgi:hypothetical protein
MQSIGLAIYVVMTVGAGAATPRGAGAQTSDQAATRAQARFRELDTDADGVLVGREAENCRCRSYDTDGDGQLTRREFYLGFMLAAFENQPAAEAPRRTQQGRFGPGDRVELYVDGTWYPATVLSAMETRYQLARDDRTFGVASSDEWVSENRLRRYVAKGTAARPPAGTLPSVIPRGVYTCVTYGTYNTTVGRLRILGDGVASGITPDGSGPQRRFTYDPATGNIDWAGGLQVAGWTVERSLYAPETSGAPNINLHYRLRAGGNLNSMYCKREGA